MLETSVSSKPREGDESLALGEVRHEQTEKDLGGETEVLCGVLRVGDAPCGIWNTTEKLQDIAHPAGAFGEALRLGDGRSQVFKECVVDLKAAQGLGTLATQERGWVLAGWGQNVGYRETLGKQ
jgi:hypothetical protein